MKRFVTLIALLAMMTILATGLAACGGSDSGDGGGGESTTDAVAGNWYLVDGSNIVTLKLDGAGGGSLAGGTISYSLADSGDALTLTIDGESIELSVAESDEYGTVLQDGEQIYAYRDKNVAKEIAESGGAGGTDYSADLLGDWYVPNEGSLTTLTFKDGGVASIDGNDLLTYTLEGDMVTLTAENNDTYSLFLVNDSTEGWVLQESNGDISGWRDKSKAQAQVKETAPVEDTSKNAFIGHWEGESFSYSGLEMTLDEAEMTFSIDINEDGTAAATTNGESDGSATWVLNDDGTITLTDSSGQLPEPSYIDSDGLLHLGLDADEDTMWIICHKQ